MKLTQVSLLLAVLTACVDDPLAPPRRPTAPIPDVSVVITGRLVSSNSNRGIAGANVRVIDAKASVGTDESGRYRIVLPASFRGRIVPVNVRAIGYKAQNRNVRLDRDTVSLDLVMLQETLRLDCVVIMGVGVVTQTPEPGFTIYKATGKESAITATA